MYKPDDERFDPTRKGSSQNFVKLTKLHPDFKSFTGSPYGAPDPTLRPSIEFHQDRIKEIRSIVINDSRIDRPWYNTQAKIIDMIVDETKNKSNPDDEGGAACLVTK